MPSGLIQFRWDNQSGPILLKVFPENLKIKGDLLSKIYSVHLESSLAANFVSLKLKNSKVISFFSGTEEGNIMVALILRRDENIKSFRDILEKAAANLLKNITGTKT